MNESIFYNNNNNININNNDISFRSFKKKTELLCCSFQETQKYSQWHHNYQVKLQ